MDTRVWKEKYDPVTDSYGGSEELFNGGIYISLQAAVPTGLYYTTYGDNYGYLYFYEFETPLNRSIKVPGSGVAFCHFSSLYL